MHGTFTWVMSQSGEFCSKCSCVRTTLRECSCSYASYQSRMDFCNWYLNQTIFQANLETVSCSLMTHAPHVRKSTIPAIPMYGQRKFPCHDCAITSTSILCQCVGRDCTWLLSGPIHFAWTTKRQHLFRITPKCSAWVTSSNSSENQTQHAVSTWRGTTSLWECSTWPSDNYIRRSLDM